MKVSFRGGKGAVMATPGRKYLSQEAWQVQDRKRKQVKKASSSGCRGGWDVRKCWGKCGWVSGRFDYMIY